MATVTYDVVIYHKYIIYQQISEVTDLFPTPANWLIFSMTLCQSTSVLCQWFDRKYKEGIRHFISTDIDRWKSPLWDRTLTRYQHYNKILMLQKFTYVYQIQIFG